ncbi:MAG: DUF2393 family protein [Campylobacterota bacterium]|nr:DUF2393 family protein [Campylobacterota bacterium]
MKEKITTFIDSLITYDYILFGSIFGLFILLIILGILLRKKIGLAIFIILLAFGLLFVGPIIGYIQMHQFLFKNSVELKSQKKLSFTNAIVVKGSLTNESKFHFSSCTIKASVTKSSKKELKNFIYSFKPFKKMSILQEDIAIGEIREFKMFIEPFTYTKDYNISLGAKCR